MRNKYCERCVFVESLCEKKAHPRRGARARLFIATLLNAMPAQKASNHRGDC